MSGTPSDEAFMAAALAIGRRNLGAASPNPAVGALIVRDNVIIAQGFTGVGGRPHAEKAALVSAGEQARGTTLYVTLEPCSHHGVTPPCVEAIIAAGVARVVCAMEDPDPRVGGRGVALLREAGVEVVVGVCESEARRAHIGHILRVTLGRPTITLKLAQTPDGFAAGGPYDRRLHITGPVADAYTHVQRLLHDAIMVGAGTARLDDPLMTVRLPGVTGAKRLRIVLDSKLSLSPRSRLAAAAREAPTLALIGEGVAQETADAFASATGIETARIAADARGRLDLDAALRFLGERGVTRVFCEGGPSLAESLIMQDLADAVILHTGIKPFGGQGLPALSAPARAKLENENAYRVIETALLGADRMTRYEKTP